MSHAKTIEDAHSNVASLPSGPGYLFLNRTVWTSCAVLGGSNFLNLMLLPTVQKGLRLHINYLPLLIISVGGNDWRLGPKWGCSLMGLDWNWWAGGETVSCLYHCYWLRSPFQRLGECPPCICEYMVRYVCVCICTCLQLAHTRHLSSMHTTR